MLRPHLLVVLGVLALAACAAGPGSDWSRPGAAPAGFWAGLWHGALLLITLIVSFFADTVRIYEANNTGIGYDIGFVLGVLVVYGSGASASARRKRGIQIRIDRGSKDDREIERRIKQKVRACFEDEAEWKELGARVESKLKRKIRQWLAEDDEPPPREA